MNKLLFAIATVASLGSHAAGAVEGTQPVQGTFGKLDHVFVIMMENQTGSCASSPGYTSNPPASVTCILGNPNAPFINEYAAVANQATNYYGVGHPSLPNYLEIVGGSNFGVAGDFWPNWIGGGCVDNAPNSTGCNGPITPIETAGTDNPVIDTATPGSTTQCNGQLSSLTGQAVANNCALYAYSASAFTPKSIADQLVAKNKTWKSYQEGLPTIPFEGGPVAGVNYSDGELTNLSPRAVFQAGPNGASTPVQKLYAVKHNPFVYFANVQQGTNPALSFENVRDFDGPTGLWADLATGNSPNFSFIVPNQCHDQHGGISGGTPICSTATETEEQLLLAQGDAEVEKIVNGIHNSKSWNQGRNAIVLLWDENDYSNTANTVVMLVETNYAPNGTAFSSPVDHFSLLRTLEAAFGLPCLNHACNTATSITMNAMFGGNVSGQSGQSRQSGHSSQ